MKKRKIKYSKYTRRLRHIMNTWRILLKLKNTKKLKNEVSKNKHTTDKGKNNQIHSQIKIHNEHLNNISNKLANTKNWTWRNTKQTWALLKMINTKNWTEILPQNTKLRWRLLKNGAAFLRRNTKQNQTINIYKSNKPQNSQQKRLTKIFNQQLTIVHYLYPSLKNQKKRKTI